MNPKRLKVLLASSSTTVLPSMKYIIKRTFKHDVIVASDPREVIRKVMNDKNTAPFDVVITGAFKHQEMNYTAVAKSVKKIDPNIHYAVYTNDAMAEDLAKMDDVQVDGFFLKKNGPHADLKPFFDKMSSLYAL